MNCKPCTLDSWAQLNSWAVHICHTDLHEHLHIHKKDRSLQQIDPTETVDRVDRRVEEPSFPSGNHSRSASRISSVQLWKWRRRYDCLAYIWIKPITRRTDLNFKLLSLFLGRCSSEIIKGNTKPLINLGMKSMILITDLSWSQVFFQSLRFCSCTVLIRSTDVENVPTSQTTVSSNSKLKNVLKQLLLIFVIVIK